MNIKELLFSFSYLEKRNLYDNSDSDDKSVEECLNVHSVI